jgi:hypothetical protein
MIEYRTVGKALNMTKLVMLPCLRVQVVHRAHPAVLAGAGLDFGMFRSWQVFQVKQVRHLNHAVQLERSFHLIRKCRIVYTCRARLNSVAARSWGTFPTWQVKHLLHL